MIPARRPRAATTDEFSDRVRTLDAERLRPERTLTLPDLLSELIASLHALYLTPPDLKKEGHA